MARKYPKSKFEAYGIYHEFWMLGSKNRMLEKVCLTRAEAEEALAKIRSEHSWNNPSEYYIEEVDVTMRAWTVN